MRGTGADTAPLSCIHISECCFHDSSKFVVCVYRQARASWAAELRSLVKATASDASPSVLQFDDRSDRWPSEHQDEPPRIRRLFAKLSATEEKTCNDNSQRLSVDFTNETVDKLKSS